MTKYYAGAAVIAVLAGIGIGTFVVSGFVPGDKFNPCRASAVAGGAGAIGGAFTLSSETGETVTNIDVITGPTLIYFGYTFCPDVCPLDTVRNADAVDLLSERGYTVKPVFVSIDPGRDTAEALNDFTANIHSDMLGLTGSPEQIEAAAKAYKVYYRAHDAKDDYYLVDHSTFTYLMLPEDGFVEFFRRDLPAEEMADQIACFLDAV